MLLELAGAALDYEEQGSGTPVLLIHGTGVDSSFWGAALPALAQSCRVIAYE